MREIMQSISLSGIVTVLVIATAVLGIVLIARSFMNPYCW